ncbi:reverse transcriptase-like protein (fragment) [Xenorhabdus bovienii str. Jollieti]|uniref:Reverse transcriptase-like protein n=1 Tax=Xenorhabdus bovienii (strain SS-2004) TaxID=406818 RepID=D3V047_XENBS
MMASTEVSASPNGTQWQSIDWKAIESHVLKLQMRIAKATREGEHGKAKALQWVLTHSILAKLLAVKRVSQNKGSHTLGIDGIIWNTDARRMAAANQLKSERLSS